MKTRRLTPEECDWIERETHTRYDEMRERLPNSATWQKMKADARKMGYVLTMGGWELVLPEKERAND